MHDDLMQDLEILQLEAFVHQRDVGLAHAVRQLVGKIGDGNVGEEVDEDDGLQRFEVRTVGGIGVDQIEIRELKGSAEQDKRHAGGEIGPVFRQQGTGDNDDERIKKVERSVNAAGDVNDGSGENQVGDDLQLGLRSPIALAVGEHNQMHGRQPRTRPG